jgi:sugar phosphate isomerase/epimerase
MPRHLLTGFADEISPDLETQLSTMQRLGVGGLDLRSLDGVNVTDLSTEDLERVNDRCHAVGIAVQSVGSPVNKIDYDVMLQAREHERLRKACRAATILNVKRVRVFTPAVPEGQDDAMASTIIDWMADQRRLAQDMGVMLIHENDSRFWGAYPLNARRLFDELGSDNFKACFDFANTELLGFKAMDDWFPWLLPHLDTLHIKDAKDGKVVAAGEGDAQIEQTLRWLVEQGWEGALTLEPHLQAGGPYGGFSGPDLFEIAVKSFRSVMAKAGVPE